MTIPKIGEIKIEYWYQVVILLGVIFLFVGLTQEILYYKNEYVVSISFGSIIFALAQWMEYKRVTKLEPYGLGFLKISWDQMIRSPGTILMKLIGFICLINPVLDYLFDFSVFTYLWNITH